MLVNFDGIFGLEDENGFTGNGLTINLQDTRSSRVICICLFKNHHDMKMLVSSQSKFCAFIKAVESIPSQSPSEEDVSFRVSGTSSGENLSESRLALHWS